MEEKMANGLHKPFYIFDLDGTLALNQQRDGLIPAKGAANANEAWEQYFRACVDDVPNFPVIAIFRSLVHQYGLEGRVQIWSGRGNVVRQETLEWLDRNIPGFGIKAFDRITQLRPEGEFRPDHQLKLVWLNKINEDGQRKLIAVFEDRTSVVNMWRENGIACFQVAPGDF